MPNAKYSARAPLWESEAEHGGRLGGRGAGDRDKRIGYSNRRASSGPTFAARLAGK